jgi:hypothetical protein
MRRQDFGREVFTEQQVGPATADGRFFCGGKLHDDGAEGATGTAHGQEKFGLLAAGG